MYSSCISICCFLLCLILYHTPPYCDAATTSTTTTTTTPSKPHHLAEPQAPAANGQQTSSHIANEDTSLLTKGSRNKRGLTDSLQDLDVDKKARRFVGKRDDGVDLLHAPVDLGTTSEYPGYPPVPMMLDSDNGQMYFGYPDDESLADSGDVDDDSDENGLYNGFDKRRWHFIGKREYSPYEMRDEDDWYNGGQGLDVDKRARRFVGKRLRGFVGKRLRGFVGKREDGQLDKKLRRFVGKRLRGFVGKREDGQIEKKLRRFVGKRFSHFAEKRDDEYDFGNDLYPLGKRPRRFVGKRGLPVVGTVGDEFDDLQMSDMFGQNEGDNMFTFYPDKRLRRFVGKRSSSFNPHPISFDDDFGISADKRPRRFVGKRNLDQLMDVDKRIRRFLGKREDKRIRKFVGKRPADSFPTLAAGLGDDDANSLNELVSDPSKRRRHFVGKRDQDVGGRLYVDLSRYLQPYLGRE